MRHESFWLAATLACGPGATLSHRSAATLWELRFSQAAAVEVTVPSQSGRASRRGIRVHRSKRLGEDEVTIHRGIAVTTVARTLLDLADVLPTQPLKRAIHEADYRGLLDVTALAHAAERNPGRKAAMLLRLAQGPAELTRSELEDRFLQLCRSHSLPSPAVGARVEGFEVDFLWPSERIVVETDGLAAHRTKEAMERDRERDRRLLLAGFQTVRLTARSLGEEATVSDLRALLQAGTSSARSADSRSRSVSKPPRRSSTSSASTR
jgi:very-short-patch-repair endonuclease